ncbi:MAG: hypothetical protein WAZ21_00625 [Candidatus Saccharimonadales bacterium]
MSDLRPSKKQRELLNFIDGFIKGNGYGPSYREVMRALDYKSVSTVATHIDGLIGRGFLRKKDHSARSLEVVMQDVAPVSSIQKESSHIKWLSAEIEKREAIDDDKTRQEIVILKHARDILDQPRG